MKELYTARIANKRDFLLLGGCLRIRKTDGHLIVSNEDYLFKGATYDFIEATDCDEFLSLVRSHYVSKGAVNTFRNAAIQYEFKYVPALICGKYILTLNNKDDDFITEYFFSTPYQWDDRLNGLLRPVTDGCLSAFDIQIQDINLSYTEINYMVARMGLNCTEPFHVVLIPFHKAAITNDTYRYHVAQIAVKDGHLKFDYALFDDTTFVATTQAVCQIAFYGTFIFLIAHYIDQIIALAETYMNWWMNHIPLRNPSSVAQSFNSVVPVLGCLVGFIIGLVLVILSIVAYGLAPSLPAFACLIPAIVMVGVAWCIAGLRRLYIKIKKNMYFNAALRRLTYST